MRYLLALAVLAMACGGTDVMPANAGGTWEGQIASSVSGQRATTMTAIQSGSDVAGTYATDAGGTGSMRGSVSGSILTFTVTVTTPGCAGSLDGIANVGSAQMAVSYSGHTACGGDESGSGTLLKR